ncbi:hypothetical protein ACROYT_G007426 [Oculina patagonica]
MTTSKILDVGLRKRIKMVSKAQLTFALMTCAVLLLSIHPAASQQDALRWGKRDSGLSEEYAPENARDWRRQQQDNKREFYSQERRKDLPEYDYN